VSHSLPRTYKNSCFSPLRHGGGGGGGSRKRLRRSSSVTDLTLQVTNNNNNHNQHQNNVTSSTNSTATNNKGRHALISQKSLQFHDDDPIASNHEIERIIAKIQQDNKILAELDKNAGELNHCKQNMP